jgi:hypothetical protein
MAKFLTDVLLTTFNGFTGSRGATGFAGSQGIQGFSGSQGPQGTTGFVGSQGIQGFTGSRGNTGFTGSIGADGATGFTGSTGNIGSTGFTGSAGPSNTINATDDTSATTHFPVFVAGSGSNQTARVRSSATALSYVPSTGTLTSAIFSGSTLTNAGTLALSATGANIITASTNGEERVRITSTGSVGIGTTDPYAKLVSATSSTGAISGGRLAQITDANLSFAAWNSSDSATYSGILLETRTTGSSAWLIANEFQSSFQGDLIFRGRTGGNTSSERMRITSAGNVGIATTAPTFNLDVNGTFRATSITESSSIALKENVRPIEDSLSFIKKLNGVVYDRKDGSSKDEAGLIAEEVYKVLPNIVSLVDGAPEAIQYTKLTAYLIEAVKSLMTEIDELKKQR